MRDSDYIVDLAASFFKGAFNVILVTAFLSIFIVPWMIGLVAIYNGLAKP